MAVIFFGAVFLVGQGDTFFNQSLNSHKEEVSANVTLVLEFSETDIREIQNLIITKEQTVLDLLSKVAVENNLEFKTKDFGELGLLVSQIGDKINGQDNNYWQFWINNEFSQIGASQYKLSGGERIEWKFTKDSFNQ